MDIDELKQYIRSWRKTRNTKKMQVYDLAGDISDATLIRESTILSVLHALFPAIKNKIEEGYDIEIGGFGDFKLRERRPRMGVDLAHGGHTFLPARKLIAFKPDSTWSYAHAAKNAELPEGFQLPDGVHLGWRLETMFRNHNMHGYHKNEGTMLEDDVKAYKADTQRDDEDDDLEL